MIYSRKFPTVALSLGLVLLGGAWLAGCDDSTSPLAPFEPEIANVADNFSIQATGVEKVTTTLTYTWANSGTRATINHSTTTTAGSVSVLIKDNAGSVVYSKGLVPSLNEATEAGEAGSWTIVLTFSNYHGTLNMGAQKL